MRYAAGQLDYFKNRQRSVKTTVDDCVNGMLVPPGHVGALEDAMARMLMRPDQLASMARASRMKAERHFSQSRVVSQWLDVIGLGADFPVAPAEAAA